jgi:hypothetical protein
VIRILSVTPHQAVGTPLERPVYPLQRGDRVAARIRGT